MISKTDQVLSNKVRRNIAQAFLEQGKVFQVVVSDNTVTLLSEKNKVTITIQVESK